MSRRWIFATLVTGALAMGVLGGTVLAHDGGTDGSSPLQSFTSRVAGILGLDESQLLDAFKQASQELESFTLQRSLDRQVELGRLTQEQADEYLDWYQARPDSLSSGLPVPGLRGPRLFGFGARRFHHGTAPTTTQESSQVTSY